MVKGPLCVKREKLLGNVQINQVQKEDLMCPICRSTLMEPVLLPCTHAFCFSCLNKSVQLSYYCPCCRARIAGWFRSAKTKNKAINEKLWDFIQTYIIEENSTTAESEIDTLIEEDLKPEPGPSTRFVATVTEPTN